MDKARSALQRVLLGHKSVYGWMSLDKYLLLVLLVPLFQTALFSYLNYFLGGAEGMEYAALGNALYSNCIFVVFYMGAALTTERRLGTLQSVLLAPVSKRAFILSKSAIHLLEALFTSFVSVAVGTALFGLDFSRVNLGAFAVVIALTTTMMIAVGMFAGVAGLLFRKATPVLNVALMTLFLVCGVNFPVEALPLPAQWLAATIPMTHGIRMARSVYEGGSIAPMDFLILLSTGALYLAASSVVFRGAEKACRKTGAFDFY